MLKKIIVLLFLATLFPACSQKEAEADRSNNICKKIVSTAPSITETLFALGLGKNIIGVTENCLYPEETKNIAKVGKHLDVGSEAVLALNPDTVFVLSINAPLEQKLKTLGVNSVTLKQSTLDDFFNSVTQIGEACGVQKEAEELNRRIAGKLSEFSKKSSLTDRKKRVMVVIGRDYYDFRIKDVYIAGNDGFLSEVMKRTGFENAYSGSIAYPKIQVEGIIALNPDVIIDVILVPMQPYQLENAKKLWSKLPVNAAKNDEIYIKTEEFWTIPGPRIVEIAEEMKNL